MPNTRENLSELLERAFESFIDDPYCIPDEREFADHLIANGVTVQEWISVKDRLPEEDGKYLAYYHNGYGDITRVLRFAKDARKVDKYDFHRSWKKVWFEYDSEYGHYTIDDVTHWMPLPQPPKGE